MQPAATWPDTEEKRLNLVGRTRGSLRMSWIRTASCPIGDHSKLQISPGAICFFARDPAILVMVPHGPHRTLQEALSTISLEEGRLLLTSLTLGRTSVLFAGLLYPDPVGLLFLELSTAHPGRATPPPTACIFLSSIALHDTLTPKWDSHQAPRQL